MKVVHTFKTYVDKKPITKEVGRKQCIRQFCIECMQSETEPRNCTSKLCALHPFRMGEVDDNYEVVTARRTGTFGGKRKGENISAEAAQDDDD